MLQTRIVPWTNYEEFEQVYHWLFPIDRKLQQADVQRGIDRIQTWINRGEIPSSVEMTAVFIEIILRDEQHGQHMSHKELRLMYAMAIIRFVNGLVDREQKGKFAKSITTLARQLGLPPWFVDLRHASTHEKLPSLTVLRSSANEAIGWLQHNYWIPNIKTENQKQSLKRNPDIIFKVTQYKECRKTYIKEKYTANKDDKNPYLACIETLIKMMDDDDEVIKQDIIPSLIRVGGLVPAGKTKRATVDEMNISKGLVELWTPLIQGLDDGFPTFGTILVEAIIEKLDTNYDFVLNENLINPYAAYVVQEDKEDPTRASSYLLTMACWLRHFVYEFKMPPHKRTLSHIDLDDIMEGCLRNPNYYTKLVLVAISEVNPELCQDLKKFIRYIDQMMLKSAAYKQKNDTFSMVDQDELQKELQELQVQLANMESSQYDEQQQQQQQQKDTEMEDGMEVDSDNENIIQSWHLYEDWKACPMGTLPNGKVPCLDISVLLTSN